MLLLEAGPLPLPFEGAVELEPVREAALVLWGEWVDPEHDRAGNAEGGPRFYAPEIPEIQTYPLDLQEAPGSDETPRLVTRLYRDRAGERGEFVRCVAVELQRDEGEGNG